MTAGIEGRKTDTGTMKISSAALTGLVRGIDHVATIPSDLSPGVVKSRLAAGVESRSGTLVDLCRSLVPIRRAISAPLSKRSRPCSTQRPPVR